MLSAAQVQSVCTACFMTYCFGSLIPECSQQVDIVVRAMEEPAAREQLVGGASSELANKFTREGLVKRATVQLTENVSAERGSWTGNGGCSH